jgi:hypothetical protein
MLLCAIAPTARAEHRLDMGIKGTVLCMRRFHHGVKYEIIT